MESIAYDKKQFLDLLLEYRSDESKKARRNVSVISTAILFAWFLGLPLSDMSIFGMSVAQASEIRVLIMATVLVIYWGVIFLLSSCQDSKIQKERAFILEEQVQVFLERQEKIVKAKQAPNSLWELIYTDHATVEAAVGAYQLQQQRTRFAKIFVVWLRRLEFYVPLFLAVGALLVLAAMIYHAL